MPLKCNIPDASHEPKVYDCFMFWNEFDVLEIRFNELYDVVDKFVIVESCETHGGHPKPFRFEQEKQRYDKFLDKVIYIKLTERQYEDRQADFNNQPGIPWVRENWQRNQIMRGLSECYPNDIIMVSDCDEIPPRDSIPELKELLKAHTIVGFAQNMYGFFLNRAYFEYTTNWLGTGAIKYQDLFQSPISSLAYGSIQSLRHLAHSGFVDVTLSKGWHFTYIGNQENAIYKSRNFAHCNEYGIADSFLGEKYFEKLQLCTKVDIDHTFPQYVQDNIGYLTQKGLIDIE